MGTAGFRRFQTDTDRLRRSVFFPIAEEPRRRPRLDDARLVPQQVTELLKGDGCLHRDRDSPVPRRVQRLAGIGLVPVARRDEQVQLG